jgi:hypothetical protein
MLVFCKQHDARHSNNASYRRSLFNKHAALISVHNYIHTAYNIASQLAYFDVQIFNFATHEGRTDVMIMQDYHCGHIDDHVWNIPYSNIFHANAFTEHLMMHNAWECAKEIAREYFGRV